MAHADDGSDDDDGLTLSASTLAALQAFRSESDAEKARFAALEARAQRRFAGVQSHDADQHTGTPRRVEDCTAGDGDDRADAGDEEERLPDIADFKEDWQLSQFWYSEATQLALARELCAEIPLQRAGEHEAPFRIGVLCAPSVYPKVLSCLSSVANAGDPRRGDRRRDVEAWLFEYDDRFQLMAPAGKFVHYDYAHPLRGLEKLKGTFDRLIVDPPFLSDECQIKAASTARYLARPPSVAASASGSRSTDHGAVAIAATGESTAASAGDSRSDSTSDSTSDAPGCRIIVCSGAKCRELLLRLYRPAVFESSFQVRHQRGQLSNEFTCLLNYESADPAFAPRQVDS